MSESDHPEPEHLESEPANEAQRLAAELGYIEPPELRQLRREVVNITTLTMLTAPKEALRARDRYMAAGQDLIEKHLPAATAQVGLLITMAGIFLEAGDPRRYSEELGDAIMYAEGMGYRSLAERLRALQQAAKHAEGE